MKTKNQLATKVALLGMALTAIILFSNGCNKDNSIIPLTTFNHNINNTPVVTSISLIGLKSDSGYCYKIGYDLPQIGDSDSLPRISTMQLYENGVPLGPAHAVHHDIRLYGQGQYSHWGNTLYFSTSDNTNPLSNGRKYTYIMK